MRIIGGILKGRTITVPNGLPVRPTTSFATEGIFNILNNYFDLETCTILDLFSGTGHIAFEFASRGGKEITAIDSNNQCIQFIKQTASKFDLPITAMKGDVFKFLKEQSQKSDLIFADPPYDLPNIEEIHQLVFEKDLLKENGWLIIEHGPRTKLEHLPHFKQHRKYGNVNFSIFSHSTNN
ncbi:MAG: RsmD family RNA methyltransferase [Sphingobacteriaceae bacterium]